MAQNRVTFKQLLQAEATDVAQIDAVRLGSVNECLVSLLTLYVAKRLVANGHSLRLSCSWH